MGGAPIQIAFKAGGEAVTGDRVGLLGEARVCGDAFAEVGDS
jgi:hypothetical protein